MELLVLERIRSVVDVSLDGHKFTLVLLLLLNLLEYLHFLIIFLLANVSLNCSFLGFHLLNELCGS